MVSLESLWETERNQHILEVSVSYLVPKKTIVSVAGTGSLPLEHGSLTSEDTQEEGKDQNN